MSSRRLTRALSALCLAAAAVLVSVSGFAQEQRATAYKFDEFGAIRCGDELARLDNLAESLKSDPRLTAYLLVYDGPDAKRNAARGRALRMKSYLVFERRIEDARVVSLVAGRRESLGVELWLAPRGAPPPVEAATVRAGAVKVWRRGKRRTPNCEDVYRSI